VQSRSPAGLRIYPSGETIPFADAEDRSDGGHELFHAVTGALLSCVSCHPEGGDDSHVWNFATIGPRRTQSLRGGLLVTAPFHWDGDMKDLGDLMTQVFSGRMSGPPVDARQVSSIGRWLDARPPLPKSAPADDAAVARGQALFQDATVGCTSCHSGAHFSNNQNENVGTGKDFQVPSLIDVAWRAPYLHTGCAKTLRDRFNPACGGGDNHGKTSQLTSTELDDLVAYLESL
jgi:mono/diheme cytochrome c family protein